MKKIYTATSNQYYGALNKRFDKRAKLLKRMGYKYTRTPYGAMFIIESAFSRTVIAATLVSVASKFDFIMAIKKPLVCKKEN